MKITYLEHSGFLIETCTCTIIFDYYKGEIPPLAADLPLYVLASHNHRDHFNPEIFALRSKYPQVSYLLSDDIKTMADDSVHMVAPDTFAEFPHFTLRTTGSTDQGVSFLLSLTDGKTLFHAGDLNWWTWIGEETEDQSRAMEDQFKKEVAKLKPYHIDAAFLPLDPRQQDRFFWGFNHYMKSLDISLAFPMHFWGNDNVYEQLMKLDLSRDYRDKVKILRESGDNYTI